MVATTLGLHENNNLEPDTRAHPRTWTAMELAEHWTTPECYCGPMGYDNEEPTLELIALRA